MSYEPGIRGNKELEFAVFCIENVAQRLQVNAEEVYAALTEKSDILHSYIVPGYDILHTQSKDYIVDDILQVMRDRGITLGMTANPILLQKKRGSLWMLRWTSSIAPRPTASSARACPISTA